MIRDHGPAHAEYTRRLAARRAAAARLRRLERRISTARLAVFLAGVVLALVAFDTTLLSPWWLVGPVVAFAALVRRHDRVIKARLRAERAVAFYDRGVARLEDRWMGGGEAGERYLDPAHPYAADLDLFGRGSLFELLCTARTRAGEDTLAAWLLAPAPPDVVPTYAPVSIRMRSSAGAAHRPCCSGRGRGWLPGRSSGWRRLPPARGSPLASGRCRCSRC
jgi:hypothetical protein